MRGRKHSVNDRLLLRVHARTMSRSTIAADPRRGAHAKKLTDALRLHRSRERSAETVSENPANGTVQADIENFRQYHNEQIQTSSIVDDAYAASLDDLNGLYAATTEDGRLTVGEQNELLDAADQVSESELELRDVFFAEGGRRSSGPSNPRQADLQQEQLDQEVAAAEARVLAAGDNYDQQHIINPLTGSEYTDAEVRLIRENSEDAFRTSLSPAEQRQYDAWLEEVRSSGTVEFDIDPNIDQRANQRDIEANKNLAYRGIAAASFGDQDTHRDLFADNPYTIEFLENNPVASNGNTVGAIADSRNRRITIQFNEAQERADNGNTRNIFAHEYVHLLQHGNPVPPTVPNAAAESAELNRIFTEARDGSTPEGQRLATLLNNDYPANAIEGPGLERWVFPPGDPNEGFINAEPYAVAAGYFYQSPAVLQNASPELYDLMVRTTGQDPLATP